MLKNQINCKLRNNDIENDINIQFIFYAYSQDLILGLGGGVTARGKNVVAGERMGLEKEKQETILITYLFGRELNKYSRQG